MANFNLSNEHNDYVSGSNELSKIKSPVLIVFGEDDKIISQSALYEMTKELLGKTQIVPLKNCGHSPFTDCPEQLLNHIIDFVG